MVRTSVSDPIRVAWLATPALPGRIGLTFAPGKRATALYGPSWARDLGADLDRLRAEGVDLLAPLVEDHELELLAIPDLVDAARARGMAVHRLPIRDGGAPDPASAALLVDRILAHAGAGGTAVVHCRGGLGRAGTLAACCLVALGADPLAAIQAVREVRPGAIETDRQEAFVLAFPQRGGRQ